MGTDVHTRVGAVLFIAVLAALAALAPTAPAQGGPSARAAGRMSFNINADMRLVSRQGHVLNEKGTFSGSQSGTIALRFTMATSTSGSATFTAYSSRGGSVSGRTATHGRIVGARVYFTGSMTITGGTGRWSHASGRGLSFSGVVDRRSFHATSQMRGTINV
jgi:hypothetical protein